MKPPAVHGGHYATALRGWKVRLDKYRSPKHPFTYNVYKGATHGFDLKIGRKKRYCKER